MEISSTFFAFSFTLLLVGLSNATSRDQSSTATNTEFIRTSCVATTYPKLCFSSLSVHAAKIQTSPKLLANTALGVSLSSAEATSSSLRQLSLAVHPRVPLRPREVSAMADCLEELADTVDELQKSAAEMENMVAGKTSGPGSFSMAMSDVQTWVSAALTDETTCSDGFDEKSMSGELKTVVRGKIVNLAQLTSNALALINKYAKIHG